MITKEEVLSLLVTTETFRVEKTISTSDNDKFCQAICAFSNDMPDSGKKGYLFLGVDNDGNRNGLHVDDDLLKKISTLRTDGNILPIPIMSVDYVSFEDGDVLIVEVTPSKLPPVRYRGRAYIRIGPRKDIATKEEEDILSERRSANFPTFDATPCSEATIDDIDIKTFVENYLPNAIDKDSLLSDQRSVKEQMSSLRLYNLKYDCPTYAAIILFSKNPKYYLPGCYIQYVHFLGQDNASDIANELEFNGNLTSMLPKLESFLDTSLTQQRPVPVSTLREGKAYNYPRWAIRELLMNAVMHRDYRSNAPTKFYQYANRLEIVNAGGLYGNARPENFPRVNDYRNPVVAEALKVLGYVNKFNRGIARVQEELIENGNGEASFNVNNITVFEVKITEANKLTNNEANKLTNNETNKLTNNETNNESDWLLEPYSLHRKDIHNEMLIKYTDDLANIEYQPTTPKDIINLLEMMCVKDYYSSMDIFDALGISRQTHNYKRHVNPLLNSHIIARIEHKRTNNYYLTVLGRLYLMYLKK